MSWVGGAEFGLGSRHEPCGACSTDIRGMCVRLGAKEILSDVDLHLHCGELVALVGLNGAGKSTLLRAILGEIPHSGRVSFMDREHRRPVLPRIGYVPQRVEFDAAAPICVGDLFASALLRRPACFGMSRGVRETVTEALAAVGVSHLIERRLGGLSGGELQRVLLALSLTPPPNLLLLDEPLSGIDLAGRERFYRLVSDLRRQFDMAVVLVSHDLAAMVDFADRMIFLDGRVVCDDDPPRVWADPRVRLAFGLDLHRHAGEEGAGP